MCVQKLGEILPVWKDKMNDSFGHAHGVGVHLLIIDKNQRPSFSEIFLSWTECKWKQSQSQMALIYQLVVLLFESPLFCQVSEEQGKIFTWLTEILVGGVTFSIPNSAEFAAFTAFTCLMCLWYPSVKHSVSFVSIIRFPSIVHFVWFVSFDPVEYTTIVRQLI